MTAKHPPHRPAYLIADLATTLALVAACTWFLLRAVLLIHQFRPLSVLVLWLLIMIIGVFTGSCLYYKLSYFRMAMRRSRAHWHPNRKEHP